MISDLLWDDPVPGWRQHRDQGLVRPSDGRAQSWEPHFQITANEDVYNEDMQKMVPEYEWGPKILTHDRTNNEEINLLGWVFRLSIEIINVHINICPANLHTFCIFTKTKFYNSLFLLSAHAEGCPYSAGSQKVWQYESFWRNLPPGPRQWVSWLKGLSMMTGC